MSSSIVEKVNFRFRIISTATLLLLSLAGGFVWGLRQDTSTAEASIAPPPVINNWQPKMIVSPSGLVLLPVGEKSEINGKPSESAVFQSSSDVKSVSQSIVKEWELRGYLASGIAFTDRGSAFGVSKDRKIKSALGVWKNPKTGLTEGFISASEISSDTNDSGVNSIPGFSYPPQSRVGATYKSSENREDSWSGSLTAEGSVKSVSQWFSRDLPNGGWKLSENPNKNFFHYKRKGEELTLLFAEVPTEQAKAQETFVSVIKKTSWGGK